MTLILSDLHIFWKFEEEKKQMYILEPQELKKQEDLLIFQLICPFLQFCLLKKIDEEKSTKPVRIHEEKRSSFCHIAKVIRDATFQPLVQFSGAIILHITVHV